MDNAGVGWGWGGLVVIHISIDTICFDKYTSKCLEYPVSKKYACLCTQCTNTNLCGYSTHCKTCINKDRHEPF